MLVRVCGRYAAARESEAVVEVLRDLGIGVAEVSDAARALPPTSNMAPTRDGLVLAPGRETAAEHRLEALSWGLVPSWSTDRKAAARMINARVETLAERSAFRSLLSSRRCLVPADGWFEWQAGAPGGKQPWFVHPTQAPALTFAGLYTWWRDPAAPRGPAGEPAPWIGSYTVVTTAARDDLAWLHDRMPLALGPEAAGRWLDAGDLDASGARLLVDEVLAAPAPALAWHPVDRRVGSVANDDPSLTEPVTLPPQLGTEAAPAR